MKLPFLPVHSNEDITRNFEAFEALGLFVGDGAPAFPGVQGYVFIRRDTAAASGQTVYKCEGGTTWTAVI